MKPLLGIKAMMLGVFCAPFLVICIYFLIRPQPLEIPPELTHLDSGTQLYEAGLLDLAIAEYDLPTEINPDNLVAYQKRGDAYFTKGDLGRAVVDYNQAINLRSLLASRLGSQNPADLLRGLSEAYMGKALVYAWQGRDLEAQRIITRAVDFGYDPVLAKSALEGMIARRP